MDTQNLTEHCLGKKKILFSCLVLVLIIFLVVVTINKVKEGMYIGRQTPSTDVITISETGEVYTTPDLAVVNFSVVNEKPTVTQALAENTEKMNAVIKAVKSQGVEEKDLKTTGFEIYPRYEYKKEGVDITLYPSGKRTLVGYQITQTLNVKIRDLTKIGNIIQGATDVGANEVGSLQFTIDKEDDLKKQARTEAIEKAKSKAKELASQLGVKLVRITNFNESGTMPWFYDYAFEKAAAPGYGGGAESPQIEAGQNKITVTVSITYEIR